MRKKREERITERSSKRKSKEGRIKYRKEECERKILTGKRKKVKNVMKTGRMGRKPNERREREKEMKENKEKKGE